MKIDAHIHVTADAPQAIAFMEDLGIKFLNISVTHGDDWRDHYYRRFSALAENDQEHFAWCTSFDLPRFPDPAYAERVIAGLDEDFSNRAVACKIWKNIGMEVLDENGCFVQIDHPIFRPILDYMEREGRTMIAHLGEPLACWQPLDPGNPHYGYYSQYPEWHLYGRSDFPSHTEIIAARDRILERHPKLRFVGAHLGSLEHDVTEVADRFDRYPNFAVDVSARLGDLMCQDPEKVRAFFLKYPDRILFGTDIVMPDPFSSLDPDTVTLRCEEMRQVYDTYFQYFETDRLTTHVGQSSTGINLPESVLNRFYLENASAFYPDILAG
ncbi:MAG: amidohydrolase [Verrucomicrobia bacterium]|nr:MAG: amidohydrolase [Verrucomicrobiota bacterium]